MSKTIRHVSELPEWFDIRPYEQWEDKDPNQAVWAVEERLWLERTLQFFCREDKNPLRKEDKDLLEKHLVKAVSEPYQSIGEEMMAALQRVIGISCEGEASFQQIEREAEEGSSIEKAAKLEAKRILGGELISSQEEVDRVTLLDVTLWMENNEEILEEVDKTTRRLAEDNGWDETVVRHTLMAEIPLRERHGDDFLSLSDYPTIPAVLKKIERHLMARPVRYSVGVSSRESDVRKLFDYRVSAYADLKSWSHLAGCNITKKCMANALFPDGRFGETDMMPSKTVGRFIKRVEEGYIFHLTAKSAEMESMQS